VEEWSESDGVSVGVWAPLWVCGLPCSFLAVHEAPVLVVGAYGCPHLFLEACCIGFLALLGEVDARHVSEIRLCHVLDDIFAYAYLVGVDGSNSAPRVLKLFDVADYCSVWGFYGNCFMWWR